MNRKTQSEKKAERRPKSEIRIDRSESTGALNCRLNEFFSLPASNFGKRDLPQKNTKNAKSELKRNFFTFFAPCCGDFRFSKLFAFFVFFCGKSRDRLWDFGLLSTLGFRPSNFRRRGQWCWSFILTLAAAVAPGCRRDMFQQPYSKPLATSDFFRDNQMASRPLVPHTIARGHLDADQAFYTGKIGTNLVHTFPIAITRETLERGRERFGIYCSPCHGRTGEGNGMIVQRGYPAPPSYHIDRLRQAPAGHFFDVITQGYGVMYSYAQRVEPADRWAIAAYIRVLQQSQNAALSDLPPEQRAALENVK